MTIIARNDAYSIGLDWMGDKLLVAVSDCAHCSGTAIALDRKQVFRLKCALDEKLARMDADADLGD